MPESTYSLEFNGSDYGDVLLSSLPTTNLTMAVWVKLTSNSGAPQKALCQPYASGSWTANYFAFQIGTNNGFPQVGINTANSGGGYTSFLLTSASQLTVGVWYHLAATFNSGIINLYVNGTFDSTLNITSFGTSITYSGQANFCLGIDATYFTQEGWVGNLDDAALWTTTLTSGNIANIASGANNPQDFPTGLLALWHLDNGTGSSATDSSGNGNTLALVSSPPWSTDVPDTLRPPGLILHYEANLESYSNGATVTTWHDQSGNGYDGTGAATPIFATNQINGLPAINLYGTAYFKFPTLYLTDFTMMVVLVSTGDALIFGSYPSAYPQIRYGESTAGQTNHLTTEDASVSNHGISGVFAVAQGNWCILEIVCSSGTVSFYQNGISYGTGLMAGINPFSEFSGGLVGSIPLNGYAAEAILWNTALNTTDRQTYETYLTNKYFGSPPSVFTVGFAGFASGGIVNTTGAGTVGFTSYV